METNMTSESNEKMTMPYNGTDSPAADDANSGGNNPLKKGPWTSAEDAILVEYVTKYGEGNWNAVQINSGISRCGKSCRLRWANHLRPNLKKGAFSPEEEHLIVELHAKMGNKWARMAAELPGRTDNEIKNYWNTRIKRKQRAGLPIYPPDICLQSPNEKNEQIDEMTTFSSIDAHYPNIMIFNNFDNIPIVELKTLEFDHHLYPPPLLDHIPAKRLRGFESLFPDHLSAETGCHYQYDTSLQIAQSFIQSCSSSSSSSEPADWAMMKLELPSLQTQAGDTWGPPSPPLPSLESIDTLSCDHISPRNRNSGLLDAVLYESQTMKNSKNRDHTSSPVFSEGSPRSGTSFDEPKYLEKTITGCKVKEGKFETTNQMIFNRPDLLLDSGYFDHRKDFIEDSYSSIKDDTGTFLGDDLSRDCKQMEPYAWNAAYTD